MKKKLKAATFIELMTVIAVLTILLAVGLLGQEGQNSRVDAEVAAAQSEVGNAIKMAQNYALQGKTQGSGRVCGYGFRFYGAANQYQIFYNNFDNSFSGCEEQNNIQEYRTFRSGTSQAVSGESYVLSNRIELQSPTTLSESVVFFTLPEGNVFNYLGNPLVSLSLILGKPSFEDITRTVTIGSGGEITEVF